MNIKTILIRIFMFVALSGTYILFSFPDIDRSNQHLIIAAHEGDVKTVISLLDRGADINYKDSDALTPLIAAVLADKTNVINELIARKVDINLVGFEQCTALCFAAEKIDPSIFNLLIQAGADVNAGNGMKPLHRAAQVNNGKIIEQLLDLDADQHQKALYKSDVLETPLELAIRLGEKDAIIALITHITNEDIEPIYTTLLVMQKHPQLGKSQGKDLTKNYVVPELIEHLINRKIASVKTYIPDVDEQELVPLIKSKVYKALNKNARSKHQTLPEPFSNKNSFDDALGSF